MRIASFDIGKKNFAFCVEEFSPENVRNAILPRLKERFTDNGIPTEKMQECIDIVCSLGFIIEYQNLDLTENCDKRKKLDPETFHNLTETLEKYNELWDSCDIFVIEQQMSFGKAINNMALKLAQHCYSYFQIRYRKDKEIVDFPAYHKTQLLGAPKIRKKAMAKPQRKKWSVEKALEILFDREENQMTDKIESVVKKDDLADTFLQLQAYK